METSWKIFSRTSEAWESMFADCAAAKNSINIEQYIFMEDEIGRRFMDLFTKKVREGVRVRMLIDAIGSFTFFLSARAKELKAAGVDLVFFNAPRLRRRIFSHYFRDHRKILVVDNQIAHTGGVCIQGEMETWRDTHIRITGDIVANLQEIFFRMWDGAHLKRFLRTPVPSTTRDGFGVLTNAPRFRQRHLYRGFLDAIRNAKKYIYLTTPYFVPDRIFLRVILLALRRGIDVRIILPHKSDHTLVNRASHFYIDRLLSLGAKIYWFEDALLHAKSMIVDDAWGTLGSCNIDNWSFLFNYEANITFTKPELIGELRELFLQDINQSTEVDLLKWRGRSWTEKVLDALTRPLHRFL